MLVNILAMLVLPRRWAALPLLTGVCWVTRGQLIDVGPFTFFFYRVMIVAAIVRIMFHSERPAGGLNTLDKVFIAWASWLLLSIAFRNDPSALIVGRLGQVFDAGGVYFVFRSFCHSIDDVEELCRLLAIVLVPVAIAMVVEKVIVHDPFAAVFGGSPIIPDIREGKVRAHGPFAHAILAGTVGAVCLPLFVGIWRRHQKMAMTGVMASVAMVYASGSSGPYMSALAAIGALYMWRYRHKMQLFRRLAFLGYLGLAIVKKDHKPYYLMERIDVTGGSTGWYRARLIESAFQHLNEWWLAGTGCTRDWMQTHLLIDPDQVDITNHYLANGVNAGLPAILLLIATLSVAFSYVGRILQWQESFVPPEEQFMAWSLGSALFSHAVTFIAVTYFDQSVLFLYMVLALIGSAWSSLGEFQPQLATTSDGTIQASIG